MIFIGSLPLYFNSRPSARGDPVNVERKSFTPSHFNSRPSARGDVRVLVAAIIGAISIHAPPRGATLDMGTFTNAVLISIHAPPRGATVNARHVADGVVISIHAPPRGATTHPRHDCRHVVNFNSRPSARGDGWAGACAPLPLAFQFTPLREGRPELASKLSDACKLFQFTPLREGRLPQEFSMRRAALISIHAPPRGATLRAHV